MLLFDMVLLRQKSLNCGLNIIDPLLAAWVLVNYYSESLHSDSLIAVIF